MNRKFLTRILLCFGLTFGTIAQAQGGVHQWADQSVLSEGVWVKVALEGQTDGIYQISYSQLRSWGFSQPEQVGVYGYGGHALDESFSHGHIDDVPEMRIWHDSANKRILFYGAGTLTWRWKDEKTGYDHRQHPYATEACYFLHQKTAGEGAPLSVETYPTAGVTADATVSEYDELWLHEKENINIGRTGREMYGENFLTTTSQNFALPAPEYAPHQGHSLKAGSVRLKVNFVASSSSRSSLEVRMDGKTLREVSINPKTNHYASGVEGNIEETLTTEHDLQPQTTIGIRFKADGNATDMARLNYIRIEGRSDLSLAAGEPYLLFRHSDARLHRLSYAIGNLTADMQVWDVTDRLDIGREELQEGRFVATHEGLRTYALVNTASNRFASVRNLGTVKPQNLHALTHADLVIVAPNGLMAQAERLAQFRRQHDSLEVVVVNPEAIYNEYSSGTADATAIRLLMKQLYDREGIRYLLLLGDNHYRNRISANSPYLLPTWQSELGLVETSSCCCDDYFGFLDDDEGGKTDSQGRYSISNDRLDIGIGRLPVSSNADAAVVIDKIIDYSLNHHYGMWKNRLCFLSDDDKITAEATDSPNLHMRHNDQLIESLIRNGHKEFIYEKIYLPAYRQEKTSAGKTYPEAEKALMQVLQQGTLLVNFAGHGSTGTITDEQIINVAKAHALRQKNLPIWIVASCEVARFDDDNESMSEALLLNPNGGAIATIASSRVVYAQQNLRLNQAIIDHLFDRDADGRRYRLGDIMARAKVALGNDYNKLNFCLLGDPSMTLGYPESQLVIDSEHHDNSVRLKGRVLQVGSQQTDTTFNGLIYPTVFDAEESIAADKGLWQDPLYTFSTRSRKIFSGREMIRRGEFEFEFMVPELLQPSQAGGDQLVNLYAVSEEGREGQGFYDDLHLDASENLNNDETGPAILKIQLNGEQWQQTVGPEGLPLVGPTPLFYAEIEDESGIDATGNRLGHDIVLNIQSVSNPMLKPLQYVLNDHFTTFTGHANHGKVSYSIPTLPDGQYEATFRVWDIFGNVSSVRFSFAVSAQQVPHIALLQAYPSPANRGETITFRAIHDRPESADRLTVQVYTQTGIKVFEQTLSSSSSEVRYLTEGDSSLTGFSTAMNADESSRMMGVSSLTWQANVAPGLYVYRAYLQSGSSECQSQSKILVIF